MKIEIDSDEVKLDNVSVIEKPISPKLDPSLNITFTCFTHRWSKNKDAYLLYIGDSEGACHIFNTKTKEFLMVYSLFKSIQVA